jgi:hypothetical protein
MEEAFAFVTFVVVEVLLIQTGRAVVWCVSNGRWRGEDLSQKEGRIHGPAGALTFLRDGQRVVTVNGMLFAGIAFYVMAAIGFIAWFAHA